MTDPVEAIKAALAAKMGEPDEVVADLARAALAALEGEGFRLVTLEALKAALKEAGLVLAREKDLDLCLTR